MKNIYELEKLARYKHLRFICMKQFSYPHNYKQQNLLTDSLIKFHKNSIHSKVLFYFLISDWAKKVSVLITVESVSNSWLQREKDLNFALLSKNKTDNSLVMLTGRSVQIERDHRPNCFFIEELFQIVWSLTILNFK